MSPVEARHIGTVAVLLEEEVIAAVAVGHAVALVGPPGGGHTVETGTEHLVGEARSRDVEVRGIFGRGGEFFRRLGVGPDIDVVDEAVIGGEAEGTGEDVGGGVPHDEIAAGVFQLAVAPRLPHGLAVVIDRKLAVVAVHHCGYVVPPVRGQRRIDIDIHRPAAHVGTELPLAVVADEEAETALLLFVEA